MYSGIAHSSNEHPTILLPRSGITAQELGVVINKLDPQSVKIAEYYMQARGIPKENRFIVEFNPNKTVLSVKTFKQSYQKLTEYFDQSIQALVLTWSAPYRVGCMGISAAFAMGYDHSFCATGCKPTKQSDYFDHITTRPYTDTQVRPTMMLSAGSSNDTVALINRGIESDGQLPKGDTYLLTTSDKERSVRTVLFPQVEKKFGRRTDIYRVDQDYIKNKRNILFYFTGKEKVSFLDSLQFLPGAIADHLTSTGGKLTNSSQMSALRWLEAGATGSYGNAIEPCNYLEKFPNPSILMKYYFSGATLIEAYWKSVEMPGQGNFIGEPLASPFRGYKFRSWKDIYLVSSPALKNGIYELEGAEELYQSFEFIKRFSKDDNNIFLPLVPPLKKIYKIYPSLSNIK